MKLLCAPLLGTRWLAVGVVVLATAAGHPVPETPALEREMLDAHNLVREHVGVPPLAWSDKLEGVAQKWADNLARRNQFSHQTNSPYGENLFEAVGVRATPDDVVHDWASESLDYDLRTNRCTSVCGHYTQMVWRNTTEVGCAVARSGRREVWVCEYNPAGNWSGKRPY